MKLNDQQKYITIICVLVLALGGLGALNFFKFKERGRLQVAMKKYQRQERKATEKIKKIPELRRQRDRLRSVIEDYAKILPEEQHVELDAFVNIIDGYRRDMNVQIQKADYVPMPGGKEKQKQRFLRHRYKFKLLATVPDFIEFINKIENHTRFLKIDSFTIQPWAGAARNAGGNQSGVMRELAQAAVPMKAIDLTVSTYTYRGSENKKL